MSRDPEQIDVFALAVLPDAVGLRIVGMDVLPVAFYRYLRYADSAGLSTTTIGKIRN